MALITCPECGKSFSDRAAHCPQCGIPTSEALKTIAGIPTDESTQTIPQQPVAAPKPTPAPAPQQPAPAYANQYAPQPQPKKQRSLLVYILVVAVVCIGILIAMISLATSGTLEEINPEDTTRVTRLEADTAAIENEDNDTTGMAARREASRLREELERMKNKTASQSAPEHNEQAEEPVEGPAAQGPVQAAPVAPSEPAAPAEPAPAAPASPANGGE